MLFGPRGRRRRGRLRCRCVSRSCGRRWVLRGSWSSPGRRGTRSRSVEASSTSTGSKSSSSERGAAEPAEAAVLLREALGLWRGPALADVAYEEFAQPAIARLGRAAARRARAPDRGRLELGRHADLVGELDALVKEHPLRERMRSQHMLALYRSGRQADALGSFQEARTTLDDELGIAPGPVLRQLELAILRQDPSLDLAGTVSPRSSRPRLRTRRRRARFAARPRRAAGRKPLRELIVAWLVASEPSSLRRTTRCGLDRRNSRARRGCTHRVFHDSARRGGRRAALGGAGRRPASARREPVAARGSRASRSARSCAL